ncbi:uncharacterized protein LOC111708883 [Eurytemora carolleeae]|uniref:uncharacterized protein LOC111708883 n=1 Tax=Eurytemora carolleeae TaxID=1294199 RepID=UPI000C780222|nr:uncharacterized protein LOC111708883 [Eurytemora carolleeae]|eukprot:XP_023338155.1 uncharacterized protein LOC111708883 [Eurytemora affinis]
MGGFLSSCCGDNDGSESGDEGERTRLISENSPQQTYIPELIHDQGRNLPFSTSLPKVNDEQNALQNILQDTAASVIDISAIDHQHVVEQADYQEKSALYGKRLSSVGVRLAAKHARPMGMVDTQGDILKDLSEEPIEQEDLELITEIALIAEKKVSEFKIEHQEDLVVNFGDGKSS